MELPYTPYIETHPNTAIIAISVILAIASLMYSGWAIERKKSPLLAIPGIILFLVGIVSVGHQLYLGGPIEGSNKNSQIARHYADAVSQEYGLTKLETPAGGTPFLCHPQKLRAQVQWFGASGHIDSHVVDGTCHVTVVKTDPVQGVELQPEG